MARVLILGSALQDIILVDRDDFLPVSLGDQSIFGQISIGDKIDIDQIFYSTGGGGTNAATTFARYGHQSIFLGNIGKDSAGEALQALFDQEGIDSSFVNHSKNTNTGCSIILLDAKTRQHTTLTHRGASSSFANLNPRDLDLAAPDWLYVSSLNGDMDTLLRFFEYATDLGIKIMFNPGQAEIKNSKKLLGLLSDVEFLCLNRQEAAALVSGQLLTELADKLSGYVPNLLITDGPMGGIAYTVSGKYRFGIYEDIKPKDHTGAGDAFASGFLAHFIAGHSIKEAIIYGSANATSVVSKIGAKTGILSGLPRLHLMPIQEI